MSAATPSSPPESLLSRRLRTMFGLDLRSLALFRMALALLLLVDLADRWPDLVAHYTDAGVLPRSVLPVYVAASVHTLGGSAAYERVLFLLAGGAAIALFLGYRTQLATFFSWLLLLSLHARNPLVLHGGDLLERMLLFWAIFLPLGARYSLDAARSAGPPSGPLVCSAATVALLLQVVVMYWFGLAARTHPAWWGDATAVADALSLDFYATPLGVWARGLPPGLLRAATVATVALEGAGPLILLLSGGMGRLRTALVVLFVVFHVVLGLFLRIGTFPLVCIVAWLPFLPAWFWNTLARRRAPESASDAAPAASGLSPFASTLVLLCLAYVLLCNVLALQTGFALSLVKGIGIEQSWGMFAPYPTRKDGWYVVTAQLQNGKEVDPFRGGPVNWDKPERISAIYPSARWAAYLYLLAPEEHENQIIPGPYSSYTSHFANYLGSRWNAEHTGSETVESVEVYYMLRYIRPDSSVTPVRKVLLTRVERHRGAANGP